MLNLYSRRRDQKDSRYLVTGHDRFGRVGAHRSTKNSSSVPMFAKSPKWRLEREALLRQQAQERWRRASAISREDTNRYVLLPTQQQPPPSAMDEDDANSKAASQAKSNPRSPFFGFTWLRQLLQQLLCRSEGTPNDQARQADETFDQLIPRWVVVVIGQRSTQ